MTVYKIHPIVMGTKVFDKSMMTYQHGTGEEKAYNILLPLHEPEFASIGTIG